MTPNTKSNIIKYLLAILAFVVIAYGYSPEVLQGKLVNQSDISSWNGMANEIVNYNNSNPNDRTLWTNSMFGGMPATTISVIYDGDYTEPFYKVFFTGARPASYLLISLIGGFILMLAFGVNFWIAFFGGIAITFCAYNMQIIQVGHNTKMIAIAFMPWVLAGVVYAYRRSALWGGILFAFALSFQIKANHPQITYYLAMMILGYAIWQLCYAIKHSIFPKFIKTSVVLLVTGIIGIAVNANHLLPTYEYAKHTMRGGTELTQDGNTASQDSQHGKKTRSGLDLEYATQWSYGIGETANLLIPNFYGGASGGELSKKSETYKALKSNGYQGAEQIIKQLPLYWGPQPFTAGPMYMGAISIFLFILGFFVIKSGLRWWIGGLSLLTLMLGWGYHFMPASELFFNWAPMYNKFRTVSMILVILQVLIPIMGALAVNEILFPKDEDNQITGGKPNQKQVKKGFEIALIISAGIPAIFALFPSLAGSFISAQDSQLPDVLISSLVEDRMSLLRIDSIRTIFFILIAAAILWSGYKGKLKPVYCAIVLIIFVLIDMWSVDKRYLNSSHFVSKREFNNAFTPRQVDNLILEDKDPNYRVLDLSVNTFNDAIPSYHHKTIGGYSPAKMQRYQDLIERNITTEMSNIHKSLQGVQTIQEAQDALTYQPVLSMLNTKYIIIGADNPPLINDYRLGNAWFVNKVIYADNPNIEISLLKEINPANEAIIAKTAAEKDNLISQISSIEALRDTNATISLTSYAPNKLTYAYSSNTPQIAIFSEIYYQDGWEAYLQPKNEELTLFRADWILRGAIVPEGNYEIVFIFNPKSFTTGELISRISSGILFLLIIAGISAIFIYRKREKNGK